MMKQMLIPVILFISSQTVYPQSQSHQPYPVTRKSGQVDDYHGTKVADPYRWLENDTSAETSAWVAAENKVTQAFLSNIPFRNAMKQRLQEVYNYARYTAPTRKGEYYYYYKNNGLQNQSVLYRQKGLNGSPELVIDPNTLSDNGTTRLASFDLSKNGNYAVYALSRKGSDWETYYVRDMQTGKDLADSLEWIKVSQVAWLGNGFFYSRYPAPEKGMELTSSNTDHKVYYHTIGTSQAQDELIYADAKNPQRFHIPATSEDERFVFLFISDAGKGFRGNSLYYMDKKEGDKKFKPVIADVGNFSYNVVTNVDDKLLVETNDGAKNERLVWIDPEHPERKNWKVYLGEKPEPLQTASAAGGKVFVRYLKDVTSREYVYDMQGKQEGEVKLPGLGTVSGFDGEKDDQILFYSFTSFTFPSTIYAYDVKTGKSKMFRQPELPFDPSAFETKQVFYFSKDSTRVPMFLVYKKGITLDGNNPALLYAYGGFNISSLPAFNSTLIPWLEQGGVYALANLRGGAEYGEKWHEGGMLFNKQHVFDDFIAAGEYLVQHKYTNTKKLAIRGGSNGGLLIGAVINQRPDLFAVAIPQVGVMDMLRFQKFTIGWNWIDEYGTSDSANHFKNLYAYSPLHNIKGDLPYPAVLVTTADHDDRVVPAHSFKYTATMQEKYSGKNPVLIRVDTNSGHGSSNTTKAIETLADIYSFVFYNMGITPHFKSGTGSEEKKAF